MFLLIERGHASVYDYSLGWFYEMVETFVTVQEKRAKEVKSEE